MTPITPTMSLQAILDRLGAQGTTDREALIMREVLNDHMGGATLEDIPDEEWLRLMGLMEQRKLQGDPNML
ncbi:hypothetical protein LAJ19_06650 [Deinococcus taeanensis]|uniref:hypothetical protein n=1 Tax=Deinococcus taeanensis TaxID=2737050 RepID=UPI001CDD128D|nr:hypothetical protein [Deinococcus taeanensis]UBV43889.1 hypothetical protein LAJ19_06650 [Deinococcus taeanensis]